MRPAVSLLFDSGPPAQYVARLGRGGWGEGFGWTEDEAIADLARALIEAREPSLPDDGDLVTWLRDRSGALTLDG